MPNQLAPVDSKNRRSFLALLFSAPEHSIGHKWCYFPYMTKLPNPDNAIVPVEKLRDYLLSPFHPVGRFKSRFFAGIGYRSEEWSVLEQDIRALLVEGDATKTDRTAYGQKYEVRGIITGPSGKTADIVTVWIVRHEEDAPRFVTAHPGGQK